MNLLVTLFYEGRNLERIPIYRRWLDHYRAIRHSLPWDRLLFIDNASSPETLAKVASFAPEADIMRFSERMERTGQHIYPYCWRGLQFLQAAAVYYQPERIFAIDPDFFLLKPEVARALAECQDDWQSLWCPSFNCPALECQVIHGKGFERLHSFQVGDFHTHREQMEFALPVTPIKRFIGDRFGEQGITEIDPAWDYVGQLNDITFPVPAFEPVLT